MTKSALVIRHVVFEDLGLIHPLLVDRGYTVRYLDAGIDEIDADAVAAADLLVVLGGPIGANDADRYPFLDSEISAIQTRLRAGSHIEGSRTLGICLGAQLIARALGADVAPSGHTEIGYAPVTLTPEAASTPLRHLESIPVLHWHGDRFEIPTGAHLLASTPACAHQAFASGPYVLALQFHLETDYRDIERWLISYADELSDAGLHPATLRRASAEVGPMLTDAATRVIGEWLDTE